MSHHSIPLLGLALGSSVVVLALAGCGQQVRTADGPPVSLSAFIGPAGTVASDAGAVAAAGTAARGSAGGAAGVAGDVAAGGQGGSQAGSMNAGAAANGGGGVPAGPLPPVATIEPGDRLVVDAMVGQINGRPIFADEFFAPIADQLQAIARQAESRAAYFQAAGEVVANELRRLVDESLLLAEANSSLSIEESQGLRFFFQDVQAREAARLGASREESERRLLEEENLTLDEKARRTVDEQLVLRLIRERIAPRITVSTREIEREYRRRYDEFNPPPRTTLKRLRISNRNAEAVVAFERGIASGSSFEDVAESLVGERGVAYDDFGTYDLPPNELAGGDFAEAIQPFLTDFERPGDWSGPLKLSSSQLWFHVSAVETPEGQSLYETEVWRTLEIGIRQRKERGEQARYLGELRSGVAEESQRMLEKLAAIALERYGPR
ncbi:MAG: hypothetical protein AB8G96_02890 [Phycisphaerales bacterium]